ncbi:MAG: TIGR00730 family Rossman fold protein [Tatlockia sp.]|jgi:hypothetical protein
MSQNTKIKALAVFCGANSGNQSVYQKAAEQLADSLSAAHIALVYGGAKVGLMGSLANRMLGHGSEVFGVIPQSLVDVEVAHEKLTKLHIVDSMHERKVLISELADGFIMLPGGTGSLDEFFEVLTLAQLGYHQKPCGILNIAGYYDFLLQFLDNAVSQGFLKAVHRNMIVVSECPYALLAHFHTYQAPLDKKWIKPVLQECV